MSKYPCFVFPYDLIISNIKLCDNKDAQNQQIISLCDQYINIKLQMYAINCRIMKWGRQARGRGMSGIASKS